MEKTFYITKEQFADLSATWKARKAHTVDQHIIYNILRSKPADHGFEMKHKKIAHMLTTGECWKAFNAALTEAKWSITPKQFGEPGQHLKNFKATFGFDMPSDLASKFDGLKK